jgi:DNA-binding NtrC family response regulator
MKTKLRGLLVCHRDDRFTTIMSVLDALSVGMTRARTCLEAEAEMCQTPAPHIVLTETVLPDGNWLDVLDLAAKATEKVNVIVVSPVADVDLYVEVMNYGAFDFVTDWFTIAELVHVLRNACDNALKLRKGKHPATEVPSQPAARRVSTRQPDLLGAGK